MVEIVAYRSHWPEEFRHLAGMLRRALGPVAARIDHIGSTAVPQLAAKDVIDIQIAVTALDESVHDPLSALGYARVEGITRDHCPPGGLTDESQWRKWFFRAPRGQRPTNVHVRVAGRANTRYALLFRDYLRAQPVTAAAYARLKQLLAQELKSADVYPDVKDPAVDLIYLAAEAWAAATRWQPGPSDS